MCTRIRLLLLGVEQEDGRNFRRQMFRLDVDFERYKVRLSSIICAVALLCRQRAIQELICELAEEFVACGALDSEGCEYYLLHQLRTSQWHFLAGASDAGSVRGVLGLWECVDDSFNNM